MGDGFVMFFFQWVHLCGFEVGRTGYVTNFWKKSFRFLYCNRNFHLTLMRVWIHRAGIGWSRLLGIQCHVHRGRGPHVLEGGARIIPWDGHELERVDSIYNKWIQIISNYMIYIKCYMYIIYCIYIYYILYIHILKVKVCTYYAECFHI